MRHRLDGLVAYASEGSNPGGDSSDLKIGVPAAGVPDIWRFGVIAVTGWSGISM